MYPTDLLLVGKGSIVVRTHKTLSLYNLLYPLSHTVILDSVRSGCSQVYYYEFIKSLHCSILLVYRSWRGAAACICDNVPIAKLGIL